MNNELRTYMANAWCPICGAAIAVGYDSPKGLCCSKECQAKAGG